MQLADFVFKEFKHLKMALEDFKGHTIKTVEKYDYEKKTGEFIWSKGGTWVHHCHIIFRPGTIIIYGDIGEWVFRQNDIDLNWMRGAIKSPDYFLSKITTRRKKYDAERTEERAIDMINEIEDINERHELLKSVKNVWWENENDAYNFLSDDVGDVDACESLVDSWEAAGATWFYAAMVGFIDALDKKEASRDSAGSVTYSKRGN